LSEYDYGQFLVAITLLKPFVIQEIRVVLIEKNIDMIKKAVFQCIIAKRDRDEKNNDQTKAVSFYNKINDTVHVISACPVNGEPEISL